MRLRWLLGGAVLALTSALALAQKAPESLLPPGFDNPPPEPTPAPAAPAPAPSAPARTATAPSAGSAPVVQSLPGSPAAGTPPNPELLARLPTLEELEDMTPEELEEALDLKPKFDIPPAARRSTQQVGIIDQREGGFAASSLVGQNASLVRAVLAGNRGTLVSRWGHILLRRALASRLDSPEGMIPGDFAAQRAALLLRMGEADAARALVQDIDTGNYTPKLTDTAFNAYVATADFTGICPVMATQGMLRKDPKWELASAICGAFRGDSNYALSRMDRALSRGALPKIDILLAQKYAGAAGRVRRAVTIEWDDVKDMTPWRYGLTIAVGLQPPESLMAGTAGRYANMSALAPMLGLEQRAEAADRAAGTGVLSSSAMVDLYSQIYADEQISGDWADRAETLHDAYVLSKPAARMVSMQTLWNGANGRLERYSRKVLTAYAAARLPVDPDLRDSAPDLIGSMLAAGLDRNALRWAELAESGSPAWGLLVLAAPSRSAPVDEGPLDQYFNDDNSVEMRKSAFLLAGLAGLGRITPETKADLASRLKVNLDRQTRWTMLINQAARRGNQTMVALLATLGMQGGTWDKMTPRYLYNIVSALRRVGLDAEARMIAAEAVARS